MIRVVFVLLFVLLQNIGAVRQGANKQQSCPRSTPFKALTFNANLVSGLPGGTNPSREDRVNALINYLKNSDAKVVCLQEVFIGLDVEDIVDGLSSEFPYSFSELHLYDGTLPDQEGTIKPQLCPQGEFITLALCGISAGCDQNGDRQTYVNCLVTNCPSEYQDVVEVGGTKCIGCLFYSEMVAICIEDDESLDINNLGLVLLSKKPLSSTLVVPFYRGVSQSRPKGYLQAKFNDEITVACTQTSSNELLSFEPLLSEDFPNSSAQNDFEIRDLIKRMKDIKPLLLLGDFNAGPDGENIKPVKEGNYKRLCQEFSTDVVDECTFCSANPYNTAQTMDVDSAIDHIFTKGLCTKESKVVLKADDATVTTEDGTVLPLSNHYGVEATITCRRPPKSRYYVKQPYFTGSTFIRYA